MSCKDCSGRGFLPRGGYSKKNPLNLSRAVGKRLPGNTAHELLSPKRAFHFI